ncbi:hypothetical protein BLA29_004468 [Euroglyphus maynei]|uniref:Uncharacterized protein n=1 Tax=Euroglyphus maynei TaxID=6958 RepID=A0A1Y3APY5_EURMA|nr:hypothetical protein BLA29_004468 [Euroglyphus maynei]
MIRKIEPPAKNYIKQIDAKLEYIQSKTMAMNRSDSSNRPIDSDDEIIDDNQQIDDDDDDQVMEGDTTTLPYERYSHYRSEQDRNEQNILERSKRKK